MSSIDEFEAAREDLEALLVEVLGSVFNEEALAAWDDVPWNGPVVVSRLAIHDEVEDSFTSVEIRAGIVVARALASRMLLTPDPSPDDLLDAVGELGNIVGGNVKSLLHHSCRLSLPSAELFETAAELDLHSVTVKALFLGQVVELTVAPAESAPGLVWPGASLVASSSELLEKHS